MNQIRLLFGVCAGLSLPDSFAQTIPLEPVPFTEYVAQATRREIGDTPVVVQGPLRLSIGELNAKLDRVLSFCQATTAACDTEITQFAKAVAQILKQQHAPIDKSAVQLTVRSAEYVKHAQEVLGPEGPGLQRKPLAEGLMVLAVLDTPRAVRPLDNRDLGKLRLQQDQLFELGAKNVAAGLKPLSEAAKPAGSGQIGYLGPNFLEPARVALIDQWEWLARAQNGQLVIAIPTTDMVIYVSESTPTALDALRTLSRKLGAQSQNPLAPNTLLRWTPPGWETVR
ncbi:hypothetical protein E4L96_09975 [Massilia arenosa]|uniref:DUF1444 family protein n=1 Tax=Zemynaea arenosa TaxID=2561931 RepID=A0A4Y9SDK2_9BURK|nr:hypothetical protein [Massilia arenosa]TFW20819.1 hypothetical protein E4L96_09975 [Massilia arenosa]